MKRGGVTYRHLMMTTAVVTALATTLGPARAQLGSMMSPSGNPNAPVNFTADSVAYDKTSTVITATGHVRAMQNGQTLYADQVTINRSTDVATATGHVVITQADGTSVYASHAVLSKGMKNAVMDAVAARLAQNGRMIANGARRYDGKLDEMVKVIYSACNLCKTDPTAPPLWQIKATDATRDLEHKTIEYHNAVMEIDGIPVFYIPYMTQPDPSVKRRTGLLIPSFGTTSKIGVFITLPYYIVINQESDITLTPILASKSGPVLQANYRRVFNNGIIHIDAEGGQDRGRFGDSIFADGTLDLNQDWRAGFSYQHASNPTYLNDFNILPNASELTSNIYLEGFGQGSYARIDAETYQGLVASVNQSTLPIVTPYAQYDFTGLPDPLGGRFAISADAFNVFRNVGTDTRRLSAIPSYSLPFNGPLGQLWTARIEVIAASYDASHLYEQPNFSGTGHDANTGRVQPFGALMLHWPFARGVSGYGTQILEPEAQFVTSPVLGISQNHRIPNEDSLDLEYSDANLFDLNRYPGIDRIEGGSRVDYAMHAAWYLPGGELLDGIIGQSYRFHKDDVYLPDSGLNDNISDIVGRATFKPSPYLNFTYRTRLSHDDLGARMIDATGSVGPAALNFTGGYLYTSTNPYTLYDQSAIPAAYYVPRREVTAGLATSFGAYNFAAGTQRNLETGKFDQASFSAGWQNECAAVNLIFNERFTSFNLDDGDTTLLIQLTFKTLGNVGFSAL